jgi:DNA-binding protein HU-beta
VIKKELVQRVSKETNLTQKEVKDALETAFEVIKEAVANGEKVSLVGFGVFEKRERAEKRGTNPSTRKPMVIPATVVPYFRPGQEFKDAVKK